MQDKQESERRAEAALATINQNFRLALEDADRKRQRADYNTLVAWLADQAGRE